MKEYILSIDNRDYNVEVADINDDTARITVDGILYKVRLKEFGPKNNGDAVSEIKRQTVKEGPKSISTPKKTVSNSLGARDGVRAPMPGVILGVHVREGERIKAGDKVLTIEAMKMENVIQAPYDGTVKKIHISINDAVLEDDRLIELTRPEMTTL